MSLLKLLFGLSVVEDPPMNGGRFDVNQLVKSLEYPCHKPYTRL